VEREELPQTIGVQVEREELPHVIGTARLKLRGWELNDVDDVFSYAQDREWARYLRLLPSPYERPHAEQFLARRSAYGTETLHMGRLYGPSGGVTR
jgi:RimJ/RimL family protein N-acetyltransferase